MISEFNMKEKMAAVLANRLSIVDFARWMMSNSWNMHSDSAPSAVSLASEIQALLAERDDFYLSDSDFVRELHKVYRDAIGSFVVNIDKVTEPKLSLSAQNETKTVSIESPQIVYFYRPIAPSRQLAAVPVEV